MRREEGGGTTTAALCLDVPRIASCALSERPKCGGGKKEEDTCSLEKMCLNATLVAEGGRKDDDGIAVLDTRCIASSVWEGGGGQTKAPAIRKARREAGTNAEEAVSHQAPRTAGHCAATAARPRVPFTPALPLPPPIPTFPSTTALHNTQRVGLPTLGSSPLSLLLRGPTPLLLSSLLPPGLRAILSRLPLLSVFASTTRCLGFGCRLLSSWRFGDGGWNRFLLCLGRGRLWFSLLRCPRRPLFVIGRLGDRGQVLGKCANAGDGITVDVVHKHLPRGSHVERYRGDGRWVRPSRIGHICKIWFALTKDSENTVCWYSKILRRPASVELSRSILSAMCCSM